MARAVISDSKVALTGSVVKTDYSNSSVTGINHNARITNIDHNLVVKTEIDYPIAKIIGIPLHVTTEDILPFRVKFTTIGIEGGYGPSNPAPIGIAVIGLNNYIL